MKRKILPLILLLFCCCYAGAQVSEITVRVKDRLTNMGLRATVLIMSEDSLTADGNAIDMVFSDYMPTNSDGILTFRPPRKVTDYCLAVFAAKKRLNENNEIVYGINFDDFEAEEVRFSVPADAKGRFDAPVVYLERKKKTTLNEVTVTASKVMFYHKGDTLVYNADAFILSDGSMLDALIAKMPGVELKANGIIEVNGRRVEQLLINGKDMFNSNRELMLENIGAYAVKDISFYDKTGNISKLMGRRIGDDTQYVMDVKLKREYSSGWIVNAEGGYGTHDRYLGRLFAGWFNDNVSVSAYGNVNNMADDKTPGRKPEIWSIPDYLLQQGLMTMRKGGVTYHAEGTDKKWTLKGLAEVKDADTRNTRSTNSEMFFAGPTIYQYGKRDYRNSSLTVHTNHSLFTQIGDRAILELEPSILYWKQRQRETDVNASFRKMHSELAGDGDKKLWAEGTEWAEDDSLVNSQRISRNMKFDQMDGSVRVRSNIRLTDGFTPNRLELSASGRYSQWKDRNFESQEYHYGESGQLPEKTHRYRDGAPNVNASYRAGASFTHYAYGFTLGASYDYGHDFTENKTNAYLLERQNDYRLSERPLDNLPSMTESSATFDPTQSYRSDENTDTHTIAISANGSKRFSSSNHYLSWNARLGLSVAVRDYEYDHMGQDSKVDDTALLTDCHLGIGFQSKNWVSELNAEFRQRGADLEYMVDRASSVDIFHNIGNRDLGNISDLNIGLTLRSVNSNVGHNISARYHLVHDAVGLGRYYNVNNGETFHKAFNVNGNFDADFSYSVNIPLNRQRTLNLSNTIRGGLTHSVDYSEVFSNEIDLSQRPSRNVVWNRSVEDRVRLTWQKNILSLSGFADVRCNWYKRIGGNDDFSVVTCRYGATALLKLPKGWDVSTDLTLYTRRGYGDSRLNTTDLVWNARVSKSLFKGALVLVADGYDLLRQLSNVSYTVNAQARTEMVTNVIPSYVLFHAQWRFNRQPRR